MSNLTRREFIGAAAGAVMLAAADGANAGKANVQPQKYDGGIKMSKNLDFGMGITSFAVCDGFDKPDAKKLVDRVNQLPIPGSTKYVELLAMPDSVPGDIGKIAGALDDTGYGRTICGFRPGEDTPDMMSADKDIVNAALAQVYTIMECAAAAGATRIGGPLIRNHGNLTPGDGRHLQYALGELANKAEKMGLYLCQEMLVAWESNGFNCVANTLPSIQAANSDRILIHYDTAHASRQELNIISAATELYMSGKFGHAHISENGRGPITGGVVHNQLVGFLHNLASLGYGNKGEVVIVETFHPSMWDAVKRTDPCGILQKSPAEQDTFALKEAKASFENIGTVYRTVAEYRDAR